MAVVQLPDGRVVQFPEGMSDQEINQALAGPGPSPVTPAAPQMSGPLRPLALAGQAVAQAGTNLLGMPGELQRLGVSGSNWVNKQLGVTPPAWASDLANSLLLPDTASVQKTSNALGATGNANLVPQNPLEQYGTKAITGAAEALPMALLGGAPLAASAVAGGAGGAAASLAAQAFPGSTLAPLAAGLGAGLGVQGISSVLAGNKINSIASALGDSGTYQQAGQELQSGARNWLSTILPAKVKAAWDPVNQAIPSTTPTPITAFNTALADMTNKGGVLKGAMSLVTSKLPAQLQDMIQNKSLVGLGVSPTWDDVQNLRSAIGDAMSRPATLNDIGAGQLKRMYGSLTTDMRNVAQSTGVGDAFDAANAESSRLYDIASGPMAKIVSGVKPSPSDPAPGRAARRLLSSGTTDSSDLDTLRQELPEATDELAAAHLRVNPQGWNKLTPQAKQALVPNAEQNVALDSAAPQSMERGGNNALAMLAGGGAGFAGGTLLGHLVEPSMGPLVAGAAGELAGNLSPYLWRGVKAVGQNPNLLALPGAGALGASQQLNR